MGRSDRTRRSLSHISTISAISLSSGNSPFSFFSEGFDDLSSNNPDGVGYGSGQENEQTNNKDGGSDGKEEEEELMTIFPKSAYFPKLKQIDDGLPYGFPLIWLIGNVANTQSSNYIFNRYPKLKAMAGNTSLDVVCDNLDNHIQLLFQNASGGASGPPTNYNVNNFNRLEKVGLLLKGLAIVLILQMSNCKSDIHRKYMMLRNRLLVGKENQQCRKPTSDAQLLTLDNLDAVVSFDEGRLCTSFSIFEATQAPIRDAAVVRGLPVGDVDEVEVIGDGADRYIESPISRPKRRKEKQRKMRQPHENKKKKNVLEEDDIIMILGEHQPEIEAGHNGSFTMIEKDLPRLQPDVFARDDFLDRTDIPGDFQGSLEASQPVRMEDLEVREDQDLNLNLSPSRAVEPTTSLPHAPGKKLATSRAAEFEQNDVYLQLPLAELEPLPVSARKRKTKPRRLFLDGETQVSWRNIESRVKYLQLNDAQKQKLVTSRITPISKFQVLEGLALIENFGRSHKSLAINSMLSKYLSIKNVRIRNTVDEEERRELDASQHTRSISVSKIGSSINVALGQESYAAPVVPEDVQDFTEAEPFLRDPDEGVREQPRICDYPKKTFTQIVGQGTDRLKAAHTFATLDAKSAQNSFDSRSGIWYDLCATIGITKLAEVLQNNGFNGNSIQSAMMIIQK